MTVSFKFNDRETTTSSALIRWNIGAVEWIQGVTTSNGIGVIRVIDPDMNLNPETVNTFTIDVWSDSDLGGIDLTVIETGPATGIFEGQVILTNKDQSSGNKLRVVDGDTITAKYEDHTLPKPYSTADELKISATAYVGPVIPPLERVPVSYPRTVDSFGNVLNNVYVDQQVQVTANILNKNIANQPFTYLVQINNSTNSVESLSWITGTLLEGQSFSPSVSWIPDRSGKYTATIFVWQTLSNPVALSPPIKLDMMIIEN